MDHLPRLSWSLLGLVLALCLLAGRQAHAYGTVPKVSTNAWAGVNGTQCSNASDTAAAECLLSAATGGRCKRTLDYSSSGTDGTGPYKIWNGTVWATGCTGGSWFGPYVVRTYQFTSQACPPDSTGTTTCVCSSGFQPAPAGAAACQATNCQAVVTEAQGGSFSWQGSSSSFCYKGCTVTAAVRGYSVVTGTSSASGQHVSTDSSSCMGAAAGAGDGTDAGVNGAAMACETGKCPGTINGTSVCVACQTTVQPSETTASAPAGQTPQIPGAPEGTVSKTEGTTCSGGKCTTTTTYKDAEGNVTGETKEEKPELSFCAENPESPLCVQGSFGGACGAFTCKGDGVQCAIAQDQHKRNCTLFDQATALSDIGVASTTAGLKPADHPGAAGNITSVTLSGASFDQTDIIGGSSCPGDVQIATPFGSTFALELSRLCTPAAWFGNILLAFTALACVGIALKH